MNGQAVRELAEKINAVLAVQQGLKEHQVDCGKAEFERIIAAAVAPLVEKSAKVKSDLENCAVGGAYAPDTDVLTEELARWRSK